MGNVIKAKPISSMLKDALIDTKDEFASHEKVMEKNNQELAKLNKSIQKIEEQKRIEAEKELQKLSESTDRWVKSDPPAIKLNPEDLLKKLNIL